MKASLTRIEEWIRANRHTPVKWLMPQLNRKLRGHYNYYGITFKTPKASLVTVVGSNECYING